MSTVFISLLLLTSVIAVTLFILGQVQKISYFSWFTVLIMFLITSVVVAPGATAIGTAIGKSDALRFQEFWNGYETKAVMKSIQCTRNGSCAHTYKCDPHLVTKYRTVTETVSDGKGGTKTKTRQESYQETEYHSCPYTTFEYTYKVETTLDNYTVKSNVFAADPVAFRPGKSVPSNVFRGEPAEWVAVKKRLEANDPGPVTIMKSYDNYILASQSSILREYSDKIESLKNDGLLPVVASEVKTLQAVKTYGVNHEVSSEWVNSVMRFNAAFGTTLQGDLHLVITENISDGFSYANALNAYWQSDALGRNAISKNALVVVLGVNDGKVQWAEAFTGMPGGNERLLSQIKNDLKGADFKPESLIGSPKGVLSGNEIIDVKHTDGLLENAVWGVNEFTRTCMLCAGDEDTGTGFSYLSSDVQPTTASIVGTSIIGAMLIVGLWSGWVYFLISNPTFGQRISSMLGKKK